MLVPDVSILIVHTFERSLIRQLLRSLRRAAPQLSFEVIVVDNQPAFGVASLLKKEFPEVRYFAKHDQGFGAAMNTGIAHARGKYVFVCSPHMLMSATALERLIAYMETNPGVGIVGPKVLNVDGSFQYSCYRYPDIFALLFCYTPLGKSPWGQDKLAHFFMLDIDRDRSQEVDWLASYALCARTEVLKRLGAFDERFFKSFEDTDLCWRVWEAGFKVVYYPEAVMIHYERRASMYSSIFFQSRSLLGGQHLEGAYKFFRKHSGQTNPREVPRLSPNAADASEPSVRGDIGT